MQSVIPAFRITDYERAKAYYVGGLGFAIDWEHRFQPDFPVFLSVSRDGFTLYLSQHSGDCEVGGLVHLYVPDVDAWYTELNDRGVAVDSPPRDQPWGLRVMQLIDPDGNKLRVCTRLAPSAG